MDNIEELKLKGGVSSHEVENIEIEFIKCVDEIDETRCKSQAEIDNFVNTSGVVISHNDQVYLTENYGDKEHIDKIVKG